MDKLIDYFIEETNKKFDDVKDRVDSIHKRLDDIEKFKVEMMVSSRWVSLLVSAACGLITLTASSVVSIIVQGCH